MSFVPKPSIIYDFVGITKCGKQNKREVLCFLKTFNTKKTRNFISFRLNIQILI
jgi:hypothetical protein